MKLSKRVIALLGAAFSFAFLMLNDPDALAPGVLDGWKWLLAFPAACVVTMRSAMKVWVDALLLLGGVLAGACFAALLHASNLWPIAGVYWAIVFALPIVLGSIAGGLARHFLRPHG